MSFFSSFKPGIEVLGANLDGDGTLRRMTGVIDWRISKTKHWRVKESGRGEYTIVQQRGLTNEDAGGTVGYIEIWQRIPWWRRWFGVAIDIVEAGCCYDILIPGSKEGLLLGASILVAVSPSKHPIFGSFVVQSIMFDYRGDEGAKQRFLSDAELVDRSNMLRNPYVFRDLRSRRLRG